MVAGHLEFTEACTARGLVQKLFEITLAGAVCSGARVISYGLLLRCFKVSMECSVLLMLV